METETKTDRKKATKMADYNLGINVIETSLLNKIKLYKRRSQEIENYLFDNSHEWGRFQNEFNSEVNGIFRDIMNFEKVNLANNREDRVNKLQRLFVNKVRKIFTRGDYIRWSLYKPFGYAGDFKIIEDIYRNSPTTTGFDRLFDNYYQMSSICVGVRNRKEDFKKIIISVMNNKQAKSLRIMNLGSGPSREIKEILHAGEGLNENVVFDCFEYDTRAIEYSKKILNDNPRVNFINENVIKLALTKNIEKKIKEKYDLIYSTGLFDYLNYEISKRMIQNLKKLLKPGGVLAISDVRDKYSNPSVYFMEWVGDWSLLYRTDDEFREIFIDSGFAKDDIKVQYEQQGIMQYIVASNG